MQPQNLTPTAQFEDRKYALNHPETKIVHEIV